MTRMSLGLLVVFTLAAIAPLGRSRAEITYPSTEAGPSAFLQGLKPGAEAITDAPPLRVDLRGDPAAIEFQGVTSFAVENIRKALAGDMAYQAAARPSADLQTFLDVLKNRVEEGYGRAGIPARVKVSLSTTPPHIVVACKDSGQVVKFAGFKAADDTVPPELLERIRGTAERGWYYRNHKSGPVSTTNRDAWTEGEPWPYDEQSRDSVRGHVGLCFLDCNVRPGERYFDIHRSDDETNAEVVIKTNPNQPAGWLKLSPIEVNGLTRHTREEVLTLIGITEGDPLHYTALDRACRRLAESHCFWRHRVDVVVPDNRARYQNDKDQLRLVVSVEEDDRLPKLGEPLRDVDQALLRSGEWLSKLEHSPEDVVIGLNGEGISGSVVLSPAAKSLIAEVQGEFRLGDWLTLKLDHAVIVDPQVVTILDRRREEKFSFSGQAPVVSLKLQPTQEESGEPSASFKMGIGLQTETAAAPWDLCINPMAFLKLGWIHGPGTVENGVLTLQDDEALIRIDATTGRWIEASLHSSEGLGFTLATRRGEFADRAAAAKRRAENFTERSDSQGNSLALASFALDQVLAQIDARQSSFDPASLEMLKQALQSPELAAWLEQKRSDRKQRQEGDTERPDFEIPVSPELAARFEEKFFEKSLLALPRLADLAFERGSWPWTLMREFALEEVCRVEKDNAPLTRELKRLFLMEENGPLFALLAARRYEDRGAAAAKLARLGLDRLGEVGLRRDLSHFTEGELLGAVAVEKLTELARRLDEQQRDVLLKHCPELARSPLTAILERVARRPDEPPREAVVGAVVEAWNDGWREQVEEWLRQVAEPVL